ncbi:hypothetical protein J1N35_042250 [Gossypium stocksii]|uniref:NmrA-like domain-containing protein n=1 Tax=Gossypium stocksii TaxID=47602 RepID=A0A9D3UH72_9ROSI|nr:hypothetical protein J1N35_042250 [Gossypium stocksii]
MYVRKQGELKEYETIVAILRQVDIVISLLPFSQVLDQIHIIEAVKVTAPFTYEEDIANYTIRVANDPRTCNKIVIYRMQKNILSQIELISLWEKKTGKYFKKVHVPEEELVKLTETSPFPDNVRASILHGLFVKGDLVNDELRENDLEASSLYPDYKYTTIDQLLDVFLVDPPKPALATF